MLTVVSVVTALSQEPRYPWEIWLLPAPGLVFLFLTGVQIARRK